MTENTHKYYTNRFVMKSPRLMGLSQQYYIKFFLSVIIALFAFMATLIIISIFSNNGKPALAIVFPILVVIVSYIILKVQYNRYGDKTNEPKVYKKMDKEIFMDNPKVFDKT